MELFSIIQQQRQHKAPEENKQPIHSSINNEGTHTRTHTHTKRRRQDTDRKKQVLSYDIISSLTGPSLNAYAKKKPHVCF